MSAALVHKLHHLRANCVTIIDQVDSILAELPDDVASPTAQEELCVPGKCKAITQHALDRYRERTGTRKSDEAILTRIVTRMLGAVEWELKPRFKLTELLAHGQEARYWREGDLLFVVENQVIVTVHHGTADRWRAKPCS